MKTLFRIPKNLLIAAAVVALMSGAASQARAQGKTADLHYVAVGVSKMPLMPKDHQLQFPHKDAQDLAKVWNGQKGKLYQNVRGEVLTNETANKNNILAALNRLATNAKTGDTVVFSLAGHGGMNKNLKQWIFEPSNTDPKNYNNTILTETQIRSRLSKLTARGVTVIVVLDTCQAGAFGSGSTGVIVLGGCNANQSARDDQRVGNGIFTFALIEALNGKADANGDGLITLAEIRAYVAKRVNELNNQFPANGPNGSRFEQTTTCYFPAGMNLSKPLARVATVQQLPGVNMDRVRK
ncbi:MAG TPA: hypothetical protein VE988_15500 [Gemmataceae bacterium]|nr:hypothetical protein [Gemmataceae bacterium]